MEAYKYKMKLERDSELTIKDLPLKKGQQVEVILMIQKTESEAHEWSKLGIESFSEEWSNPENDIWDKFYKDQFAK